MLNKDTADGRKRNIIFWYDENAEFTQDIDELQLENAKVVKLTDNNSFCPIPTLTDTDS